MKRAIVAFMVVAGFALMTAGCGPAEPAPKAPGAPATTPMTPPAKAPMPPAGER